jgi:hypothetical protein
MESPPEKTPYDLEIWKKIIDVQQHFNSLCMEVRKAGTTVVSAMVGAAFYMAKEQAATASSVAWAAVGAWVLFGFMDFWYHAYLKAAVTKGHELEDRLSSQGLHAGLSIGITRASHMTKGTASNPAEATSEGAEAAAVKPPEVKKLTFLHSVQRLPVWVFTFFIRRSTGRLLLFYLLGTILIVAVAYSLSTRRAQTPALSIAQQSSQSQALAGCGSSPKSVGSPVDAAASQRPPDATR